MTALRHRSGLRTALINRDEVTLQPVLRWIIKNIADYRFTRLTTDVALLVLDLYADQLGRSEEIDNLVEALISKVKLTVEASQLATSTQGMVDMLSASAAVGQVATQS